MRILADIGEVGVHVEGAVYKLRPSLYAISQLGTPKQIVEKFALLMHDFGVRADEQLMLALEVVNLCACDDMPSIFGECELFENKDKPLKYKDGLDIRFKAGRVSENDLLQIARALMRHGVIGDVEPSRKRKKYAGEPNYLTEFVARDHVATAVAHLGYSEEQAWDATMTAIVSALKAKYPSDPNSKESFSPPSVEEMRDTMKKMKLINAVR